MNIRIKIAQSNIIINLMHGPPKQTFFRSFTHQCHSNNAAWNGGFTVHFFACLILQVSAWIRMNNCWHSHTGSPCSGKLELNSCRCMKTDLFSGQAWRGYDCAARCLVLIIRLQNLSALGELKSIFYNSIAIIFASCRVAYSAFKSSFSVGEFSRIRIHEAVLI